MRKTVGKSIKRWLKFWYILDSVLTMLPNSILTNLVLSRSLQSASDKVIFYHSPPLHCLHIKQWKSIGNNQRKLKYIRIWDSVVFSRLTVLFVSFHLPYSSFVSYTWCLIHLYALSYVFNLLFISSQSLRVFFCLISHNARLTCVFAVTISVSCMASYKSSINLTDSRIGKFRSNVSSWHVLFHLWCL